MFSIIRRTFTSQKKRINKPLVWVDCETTGLDLKKDSMLEIAVLITDGDLNIVAEGPELVIQRPPEVLNEMNEWCVKQHSSSGLTEKVLQSKISIGQAEKEVLGFLKKHTKEGTAALAGNSVHFDRGFLQKEMPSVIDHLHFRVVDVSTINELAKRWNPSFNRKRVKKHEHRALNDIIESIDELKYYKENFFVLSGDKMDKK